MNLWNSVCDSKCEVAAMPSDVRKAMAFRNVDYLALLDCAQDWAEPELIGR
jgi:hypothetical protein